MEFIRRPSDSVRSPTPSAVVIGNFDGLHLGHQALIERMHVLAQHDHLVPALMCFEPLPVTFFTPNKPVPRLMSVRDKLEGCRRFGIERVLMCPFDESFSKLTPQAFAQRFLVEVACAQQVIVGEDFRFGAKASGDVQTLSELGRAMGFQVHPISAVTQFGERLSSSRLREAAGAGDLQALEAGLGRPYTISGRVLRGRQIGQQLGYPTLNIRPPEPPALHGIFAVTVSGASDSGLARRPGVASLGQRPTVNGQDWLLEVHLFDYDGPLYGQHLNVTFEHFIRHEAKFDSLGDMVETMHEDARMARQLLIQW